MQHSGLSDPPSMPFQHGLIGEGDPSRRRFFMEGAEDGVDPAQFRCGKGQLSKLPPLHGLDPVNRFPPLEAFSLGFSNGLSVHGVSPFESPPSKDQFSIASLTQWVKTEPSRKRTCSRNYKLFNYIK